MVVQWRSRGYVMNLVHVLKPISLAIGQMLDVEVHGICKITLTKRL